MRFAKSAGLFCAAVAARCPLLADDPPAEVFHESGFVAEKVATGLNEPIAIDFLPDGRLIVAERGGTLRFVQDGAAGPPLVTLEVHTTNENGLLGMAVAPDFETSRAIYLFATISPQESRIYRIREQDGVAVEFEAIRENLPTRGSFHSGGGLKFGPDGKLYFSIGDNLEPENSQRLNTLAGKISRLNPDGSIPEDNPFYTPTGQPRPIFALGLRNPFRFCFAPDGRMFALDVGSDDAGRREELNLIVSGGNYGWPLVEGYKPAGADPALRDPIYAYHDGGAAPVGAVYYTGHGFPAEYSGNLFHLEYVLNRLYRVVLDGDRVVSHTVFMQGTGGPVDLAQGPDGALYYTEIRTGSIKRIRSLQEPQPAPPSDGDASDADEAGDALLPLSGVCGLGAGPAGLLATLVLCSGRRGRG